MTHVVTLKEAKYSLFRKGKEFAILAPKGAKLQVISIRGDVLIVEYRGDRFSVHKNLINETDI